MLTMQGNRARATLRMDTPFGTEPLAYARTLVSHLTADESSTCGVLVVRTDENSSHIPRSYSEHVAALPLDTSATSTGNAALIDARNVTGFTAPAPFTGDAGTREAMAAYRPDEWPERLESSRDRWAEVLGNPATLTARAAQELSGAFQHPTTRDCLMTDVITRAPDQFTSIMLGMFPTRPDWARVDTAQEVAFELMKATPEGQRAPMLCLIGWLEWLKGKSSLAARYFKLALEDATDYRLAVLLAELVNRGLVADCARNRGKSYARPMNR